MNWAKIRLNPNPKRLKSESEYIDFITNDCVLQSIPLDFVPAKGKHCGKDIAELTYTVLKQNNLEDRVQGITEDHAAVNTKFLTELSNILRKKDKMVVGRYLLDSRHNSIVC